MAIQFKTLNDKLRDEPLSSEELSIIDNVEKYIDSRITIDFKGDKVYIDLTIAHFNYDISSN